MTLQGGLLARKDSAWISRITARVYGAIYRSDIDRWQKISSQALKRLEVISRLLNFISVTVLRNGTEFRLQTFFDIANIIDN